MERLLSAFSLKLPRRPRSTDSQLDPQGIAGSEPESSNLGSSYGSEEIIMYTNGDGNIIQNPYFEDGLNGWSGRGCKIVLHNSRGYENIAPLHGRFYASSIDRSQSWNGIQQDISSSLRRKIPYEVTAVVRILGNISSEVRACLWVKAPNGREQYLCIASSEASDKEWVMLQGKFLLNGVAANTVIYIEGPPMGIDILVNGLVVKRAMKLPPSPPPVIENVLFGVNIIKNSNLNQGLYGWSPLGSCTLSVCTGSPSMLPTVAMDSLLHHQLLSGYYIHTTNRTETWMGPSQKITDKLKLHLTYQVAAWVRVGSGASGPQNVSVALHIDDRWLNGGQVQAIDDRWYEIGGSFRLEKKPSKVVVYIQGPLPGVDLMVAGLHIIPVDRKARFEFLKEKTDKLRKRNIILKFPGSIGGSKFVGAAVKIRQIHNSFPIGSHINRSLIDNEEFVDFFLKNFNWAVFGNESKWYANEPEHGKYNYRDADELLDFCIKHGIETRGHCIFWEVEDAVQSWVRSLNKNDLLTAVQNRLASLLSRYKGKFRHYDVNNEMLHGSFYKDRLGEDIRAFMFREAHRLDPSSILFVNDYNVEDGCDFKSTPEMYVNHILDLQERGALVGGIGLQGHISHPAGPIVCAALDKLGILGIPIWFTELDVSASNEHVRAEDLEVILREAYAHPSVGGIMIWGHFELMCRENSHLVDADSEINEAGKRFIALKQEWLSSVDGHVDGRGEFSFRGFEGNYTMEVITPLKKSSVSFVVDKGETPLVLTINL